MPSFKWGTFAKLGTAIMGLAALFTADARAATEPTGARKEGVVPSRLGIGEVLVRRDGTLTGPNVQLLESVTAATDRPVIASGGVSNLADLRAISQIPGVEGAIVGKALYAGAFTLPEALAATR